MGGVSFSIWENVSLLLYNRSRKAEIEIMQQVVNSMYWMEVLIMSFDSWIGKIHHGLVAWSPIYMIGWSKHRWLEQLGQTPSFWILASEKIRFYHPELGDCRATQSFSPINYPSWLCKRAASHPSGPNNDAFIRGYRGHLSLDHNW